jgi:hypothetical protein
MTLIEWALRHSIPHAALVELNTLFRLDDALPAVGASENSESAVQRAVRLEASALGHRLWRNNVGAGKLDNGSFIRWGLANETAGVNKVIKSSDLIGIRSDGVFMAREIKPAGWRYAGTEREIAQLAFLKLITGFGGDACFATGTGTM